MWNGSSAIGTHPTPLGYRSQRIFLNVRFHARLADDEPSRDGRVRAPAADSQPGVGRGTDLVPLGRTGLRVSRLGLGTAGIGALPPVDDHRALAVIRHAVATGIGTIDTAPLYGFGRAEERIGRALADARAPDVVLSTKVGVAIAQIGTRTKVAGVLREAIRDPRSGVRLVADRTRGLARRAAGQHPEGGVPRSWPEAIDDPTYDGAMRSVEGSLARLGVARLDLLFLHDPSPDLRPVMDGAYRALEALRSQGVVAAVGVAPNDPGVAEAYVRAGDFDAILLGRGYSLLDRRAETSLLPLAEVRRIPVIVGGPFASGILADPSPGAFIDHRPATDDELGRARHLATVTTAHGVPLRAAAIAFPYRHPAVVSVLVGATDPTDIDDCLALLATSIPPGLWSDLDDVDLIA
jgi:D-threo-aldose 1-dehydrogenase